MGLHVVVGAGPIGTGVATLLRDAGREVALVTRSGTKLPGVTAIAADVSDQRRVTQLARGAEVIYNCANPAYHRWLTDWPPIADSLLAAAIETGAVLVTMSNLYGYGKVTGPMSEATPLRPANAKTAVRARLWQQALAAHEAGQVRVSEARASDFLGRGSASLFGAYILPTLLAGKTVMVPGDPQIAHSFTYTGDAAALLVRLGSDSRAWGRPWHVPTAAPTSIAALATAAAQLAGAPAPRLRPMSSALMSVGGIFSRDLREMAKVRYQFTRPFELDSSLAQRTFGISPTSTEAALREMV